MTATKKMTPSMLKAEVNARGSYFFYHKIMRFCGDRMANYGVRANPVTITTRDGSVHQCWELYRKLPVNHNIKCSTYFDTETFEVVSLATQYGRE